MHSLGKWGASAGVGMGHKRCMNLPGDCAAVSSPHLDAGCAVVNHRQPHSHGLNHRDAVRLLHRGAHVHIHTSQVPGNGVGG